MRTSTLLFDSEGHPTKPLRRFLEFMKLEHGGTLAGIRDATQATWYQAGKLRSEIVDPVNTDEIRPEILRYMDMLGCISSMPPNNLCSFDYALLLGGTVVAVRKRLRFLMELNESIRFSTLILLGSERPLDENKESLAVLFNPNNEEFSFPEDRSYATSTPPMTEFEMMHLVLKQADFKSRHTQVISACAPGKANTVQTIEEWLKTVPKPKPGSCMIVSSQPFVTFQKVAIANALQWSGCTMTGIGPEANQSLPIATFLDNIAKLIFELAKAEGV